VKRLLITGSRSFTDTVGMSYMLRGAYRRLKRDMDVPDNCVAPIMLVSGNAKGADLMAEEIWAAHVSPELIERWPARDFPHPLKRNDHMVSFGADYCLAFPTYCVKINCPKGKIKHLSHGTDYTIKKAKAAGIDTHVLMP
jgi:hypothetical protein